MKAYLEPSEIAMIEDATTNMRDSILIRLLFRLGCRITEVLSIKVDDIDFNQGTITIIHLKYSLELSCPTCGARHGASHIFCPKCVGRITPSLWFDGAGSADARWKSFSGGRWQGYYRRLRTQWKSPGTGAQYERQPMGVGTPITIF